MFISFDKQNNNKKIREKNIKPWRIQGAINHPNLMTIDIEIDILLRINKTNQ